MGNNSIKEERKEVNVINQTAMNHLENLQYYTAGLSVVIAVMVIAFTYFLFVRCRKNIRKWLQKEMRAERSAQTPITVRQVTQTAPTPKVQTVQEACNGFV